MSFKGLVIALDPLFWTWAIGCQARAKLGTIVSHGRKIFKQWLSAVHLKAAELSERLEAKTQAARKSCTSRSPAPSSQAIRHSLACRGLPESVTKGSQDGWSARKYSCKGWPFKALRCPQASARRRHDIRTSEKDHLKQYNIKPYLDLE